MKTSTSVVPLILALAVGGQALAQEAKGNAPLKQPHTVNDGASKPAANSFTEGEARTHILHSGYSDVSGLTKGSDGIWRGTATRDGTPRPVELDFKGNVVDRASPSGADQAAAGDNGAARSAAAASTGRSAAGDAASGAAANDLASRSAAGEAASADSASRADAGVADRRAEAGSTADASRSATETKPASVHTGRAAKPSDRCARPGRDGAACSGVDNNRNGVSDREDHAVARGARP